MGELKTRWARVKFGEVVRQVKDKVDPTIAGIERVVRGEHMDTDELRIRRWDEVGDDYLGPAFHMRFRPGQVLYGSRRTYLRKVALADFEGITANTTFVVETSDPAVLLPELLPFIMTTESFHDHSVKQSKGSVNPYVNFSDLAWYEFALPPLDEQRSLAKMLSSAFSLVDASRTLLGAAENAYAAGLQNHFPLSLAQDEGSRTECVGDLCERVTDGTHQSPTFTESGVPFLMIGNISSGAVDWDVDKHVSEETYQELTRRFRPSRNDVLYSVVGVSLGVPVLVDWDRPFMFQRHIGVLRCKKDKLLPEYLLHFLRSSLSTVQDRMYEEGNAQKTVTLAALRSYRIPRRSLNAQHEAIGYLNDLASAVTASRARVQQASELLRVLLRETLS